jgi:polysaccharide biosynthesis protein PslH
MKIFMLVSRIPWPLEKGDKLRAFHQVKWMAQQHDVLLCCLDDKDQNHEAVSYLKTLVPSVEVVHLNKFLIGWRLLRSVFSDKPYQVNYFYQSSAAAKIKKLISDFNPDHIYCQLIRTSEYVKHLHQYPKTLDYMDALNAGHMRRAGSSPWWMKTIVKEEARRLVAYENLIFEYFEHHTIISKQDQQLIYHPDRNSIMVIPNGVDTDYFFPQKAEKKFHIVFTGNMSYAPNVDSAIRLATRILPLIQKQIPSAKLLIAGASPVDAVLNLKGPFVEVSGWLDDIRMAYSSSELFMAPMSIGSGMQNKLLEAMSMELPCITSSLAANALSVTSGEHLMVCEEDGQFADEAIRLLRDKDKASQMATIGRQFVHDNFNWAKTVNQLCELMSRKK